MYSCGKRTLQVACRRGHYMKKTPACWSMLGSRSHTYRTGARGGAGTRPAFLSLSPAIVQGCIKQLTSNDGG